MPTNSNSSAAAEQSSCCTAAQVAQIATGVLAVIGTATVLWMIFSRRRARTLDPQLEIDRRINELEDSLSRLQDGFGHVVRN